MIVRTILYFISARRYKTDGYKIRPLQRIGPKSSVVLGTQYLDETIRLGKGSRGSYFVFTRKEADSRVPAAAGETHRKGVCSRYMLV
jgi:hypothetical protein